MKRDCISELPNTVIFVLSRFKLNFVNFQREKVNSRFEFPKTIDLFPYTRDGLKLAELSPHLQSTSVGVGEDQVVAGSFAYVLKGVVVHTGTANYGHYYSYIRTSAQRASSESCTSSAPHSFRLRYPQTRC